MESINIKINEKEYNNRIISTRDKNIDIMKGIGIVLMVLGHCSNNRVLIKFIYLFHMSLFFMISGYLWNNKHSDNFSSLYRYIINKIKSLYIPYVLINFFLLVFNNLMINLHILSKEHIYTDFHEIGIGILKILLFGNGQQLAGACWFLRILFLVSIVHAVIMFFLKRDLSKCNIVILLLFFGLSVCAMIESFYGGFPSPVKPFFASYISYLLGILIKQKNSNKVVEKSNYIIMIAFLFLIILSPLGTIELNVGRITNVPFYILCSLLGWVLVYSLSRVIVLKKVLSFLGKRSIYIVIFHFLAFKIVSYCYIVLFGKDINLLTSFPVVQGIDALTFFYLVFGLGIPMIICLMNERIISITKSICFKKKDD